MNPTTLKERFYRYIKIDTQSDPSKTSVPTTEKQWVLARMLKEELLRLGLENVSLDDKAYVMATLPSNVDHEVPAVGFVSHFDTSPDFKADEIKPRLIENYDGKKIVLNTENNIVLDPDEFDDLKQYKGQDIIVTDGTTLLSADDKAGITEIMTAVEHLIDHPEIKHGPIQIGFTPDEEVGRGAHHFDVDKFGAEWAYTMDGSQIGELEYENFNAAEAVVEIDGKIVHPGYAKNTMLNSQYIASDFIRSLPRMETPEHTEAYQGFFHLTEMQGKTEKTRLHFIIRDHDAEHFDARKSLFRDLVAEINGQYDKEIVSCTIEDQYYNMKKKIEPVMHIVDIAEQAMLDVDVKPLIKAIRGGTDGAQLSYKDLPCPNIFAGGHNFHGPYEYLPVQNMVKATEVIVKIAELTAQRYN